MNNESLQSRLKRLQRRVWAIGGAAGVAWGLSGAMLGLFACLWLDLLWELSPYVRVAAWIFVGCVAAAIIGPLVRIAYRAGARRSVALRMDRVAGTGGEILSGLDLEQDAPSNSRLSTGLALLAVDRAATLAGQVHGSQVVAARPLQRSFSVAVGIVAGAIAFAVLVPDLAATQWQRFTDPFGDHPPFSRVKLQVEPGDARVIFGQGLEIRATTEGPPVERVELVLKTAGKDAEESLPMFPEPSGAWRATLTDLLEPAQYFVRAGGTRSRLYSIEIITVPRIESLQFRITPPAYTNQSPYEGPLPKDGLAGLPGTIVHVTAKSNRPLSGGTLKLTLKDEPLEIPLLATGNESHAAAGEFVIQHPGKFELTVTDTLKQRSQDTFSGTITVLEDQRPFIRILEPREHAIATPDVTIGVLLAAEDDYGISSIQLFRSLNDSRPLPMTVPLPPGPARRLDVPTELPLSVYGLSPGDVIKLFARVEDNDPAGAKGTESGLVVIQIVSQEEFERMLRMRHNIEMLMSKYRQAQRRIQGLAEEKQGLRKKLKEQPADKPVSAETQEELQKLAKRLAEEAKALHEAAAAGLPYDIDKQLSQHLDKLADALDRAANEVQRLSKKPGMGAGELDKALENAFAELEKSDLEFEQEAMEPLEHLELVFPLIADQAKFTELVLRQRELAERAAALKGHDGDDVPAIKARMRDLEAEQRRIRESLAELLDDIEAHVARLPDDEKFNELRETAREFVEAVRPSGATEAMADAEGAMSEFAGTRAAEQTKNAADILEKFLSKCQSMGGKGSACLRFQPGLAAGLGNTIAQLLADLGLGDGSQGGMGRGAGGGYSARSGGARNVGLYGNHPGLGGGESKNSRQGGFGQGDFRSVPSQGEPGLPLQLTPAEALRAAGSASGNIPARYRHRVGDYFQRIAEELEGK